VRTGVVAAVEPIAREWDALAERTVAPPFMRAGWAAVWCSAFGGLLSVVCAWRDRRLVGVLPLCRRSGALSSLTNAQTPGFGMLAEDGAVRTALAERVFAARPRHVDIAHVDAGDPALAALERTASGAGYRLLRTTIRRSPFVALDGRSAGARLGSKEAANLRRRERRLAAAGTVEVEVTDGRDGLDDLLAEGFRLEGSGWKEARGTAIASRADTRDFYCAVARWARDEGLLRLAFLRLDGRGLAFQLALQDAHAYYFLKGGYEPSASRYAPGKLLAHAMIGRAAASGLDRFEFLGDAEPWKLEWTRDCHERVRIQAFAPTPRGTVDRLAQTGYLHYARPLAKRVLARHRAAARRAGERRRAARPESTP
jgi:CelD/BcsL family acetyltransferase involved in cellulose biosynthesis